MEESLMFWAMFAVAERLMPMLEKLVLQETDDVLVDWVKVVGLYIDERLLRSYAVVAKLTLAENVLYGFAFVSCLWLQSILKLVVLV
jgi:hypothetical protein